MAIIWRPQHEAHSADFLALDGERVIGRMFQMHHLGNAGRWYWTIMATGSGPQLLPPTGVEGCQDAAAQALVQTYERLTPLI